MSSFVYRKQLSAFAFLLPFLLLSSVVFASPTPSRWKRADLDRSASLDPGPSFHGLSPNPNPNPKLDFDRAPESSESFETAHASSPRSISHTDSHASPADSHYTGPSLRPPSTPDSSDHVGLFGPLDYPSPSTSRSSSVRSEEDSKVSEESLPQTNEVDRLKFSPKAKEIGGKYAEEEEKEPSTLKDASGRAPPSTAFEIGESSSAAEARAQTAAVQRKNLPPPLAAKSLPDGKPDTWLRDPANAAISQAISRLPPGRETYQHVSMADPTAPGGYQVYRFYKMADGSMQRARVPYIPDFLHDVKALEDDKRELAGGDPAAEKKMSKTIGWGNNVRPTLPKGEDEFSLATRPPPPSSSSSERPTTKIGSLMQKIKTKLNQAHRSLRTPISDLKDTLAVFIDPQLQRYHTTGGIPAVYGREEILHGYTIPPEARRIAQERGQAIVFYSPFDHTRQVRITYTGSDRLRPIGSQQQPLAPESEFKTFLIPPEKALPLPRHWRGDQYSLDRKETTQRALDRMKDFEQADWTYNLRERWPAKWGRKWTQGVQRAGETGRNAWQKIGKIADARTWFRPNVQPVAGDGVNEARGGGSSTAMNPSSWKQTVSKGWEKAQTLGSSIKNKVGSWINRPNRTTAGAVAEEAHHFARPIRRRR